MVRPLLFFISFLLTALTLTAQNIIIPGEFEKNEGMILKWNYDSALDSAVVQIASIISEEDSVWILVDPNGNMATTAIQARLTAQGATLSHIAFIEATAENPWLRDFGPVAGYYMDDLGETRHFVDAQYYPAQYPKADFLPLQLASDFSFNYEAMQLNFDFGNLTLDGIGRGFVSDRILSQNPGMNTSQIVQELYMKLSLNEIIILPSIPECGGGAGSEISRLVKFIDPAIVLVSQFPESVPYYLQAELIADTLSKMYTDFGTQLQVVRLPVAPNANGGYSLTNDGEIRSYTSSILYNNIVLIPSYNCAEDATALSTYQQLFPGYQVVQINSRALAAEHGSLFRLAVNVPQPQMFRIRHAQMLGARPFESEIWINALASSIEQVDSVLLYYKIHPSDAFQTVYSNGCCGGNGAPMSGYSISDTISYYLEAFSGDRRLTLPIGAPEATFTFWFDPFTAVGQDSKEQQLTVFPNPASDFIYIKGMGNTFKNAVYQIVNVNGIAVADGEIPGDAIIRLPENLTNGFYMIKCSTLGKTSVSKLYLHR
jgi:agmatine/peptidylarginine deiminase